REMRHVCFSSRRRHTRCLSDWSSDVCSSDLVFLKHIGKEEIVGDPNHVLFFRRNEPYRVAHPVGQGDDCTVLAFPTELLAESVEIGRASCRERGYSSLRAVPAENKHVGQSGA